MPTTAYDTGLVQLAGALDFVADACYCILVNGYTFSRAHTAYSDVSASELADVDYDPVALAGKTVTLVPEVAATTRAAALLDCNDISFGAEVSIGPANGFIILKGSAAAPSAGDPLLFFGPLDDLESTNAVFTIRTTDGLYLVRSDIAI